MFTGDITSDEPAALVVSERGDEPVRVYDLSRAPVRIVIAKRRHVTERIGHGEQIARAVPSISGRVGEVRARTVDHQLRNQASDGGGVGVNVGPGARCAGARGG